MKAERLDYIDAAKGIGILLVVFAHVNYTPESLTFIYSFHMPLFFVISGMLFKRERYRDFRSFAKRRIRTLILPYVAFELASIAFLLLCKFAYAPWGMLDIPADRFVFYLWQILVSNWSMTHVNQPLWFVPCLFLVEAMYFFICKRSRPFVAAAVAALAACGWVLESGILPFDNKLLPWSLDSALFALSFYATGNLLAGRIGKVAQAIGRHPHKKAVCVAAAVVLAAVLLPIAFANGKVSLGSKILGNGFLLYAGGLVGTAMVFAAGMLTEKSRFLTWCGRNSFSIMASHFVIRMYLVKPVWKIVAGELYNRESLAETIAPFLITLALTLLFAFAYEKASRAIRNRKAPRGRHSAPVLA